MDEQQTTNKQLTSPYLQNPQTSDTLAIQNHRLTVLAALSKLKQTEERISLAKNRLEVIDTMNSRVEKKNIENERKRNKSMEISEFIKKEKETKMRYFEMRSTQREKLSLKNKEKNQSHKERIQKFRATIQENNKWIYQQTRRQKQKNELIIKNSKANELQIKRKRRQELFQKEKKRAENVYMFRRNKMKKNLQIKQEEKMIIKSLIQEREKMLINLERKGSQASDELSKNIDNSRVTEKSKEQLRNEQIDKTYGKKFFIKSMGKSQIQVTLV